ncbi:hypothetical protein CJF42_00340 [Pseudoalteromonas sp. NBT06-2]|uniref:ferritin-like domain-containing protein n=1 Tax=Pseudoalteromonas sp. NBT06-2 TaxID=2025950 RepID=UPI000BA54299|nr:ferritin-like domain-containing protein [Pseudoalteromonas sp. NBT06-2]PAJ76383.1 hypothetical protein CJF42_00340 [Pseudoalteromonas sp. NBT06-2]
MSREDVLSRLKTDMQTACEIELATIPIYLFIYYSLKRSEDVTNGLQQTSESLFINNVAANIMSVAVEEMLHMSLSANIYYAMFGESPALYHHAPRI